MRFLKKYLAAMFSVAMLLGLLVLDTSAQWRTSGWYPYSGGVYYTRYVPRKRKWKKRRYRRTYAYRPVYYRPPIVRSRYYYDPYLRTYRSNYPRTVFSLNFYR